MTTRSALVVLLFIWGPCGAAAQAGPARLVRELEHAVDRGRADSARAAWRRIGRQRPADAAPRFALASLDRLEYRRPEAEAGFRAIARGGMTAAWRAAAHLALGRLRAVGGDTTGRADLEKAVLLADSAAAPSIGAAGRLELGRLVARAGRADSAARLIRHALDLVPADDTSLTAVATCAAAGVQAPGTAARADSLLARGRNLAATAGDDRALTRCRTAEYQVMIARGRTQAAGAALDSAILAVRRTRDAEAAATAYQLRAYIYVQFSYGLGNSRKLASQAIAEARRSGHRLAEGYAHLNLAQLAIRVGDFGLAAAERDSATALLAAIGDRPGQAAAEFVGADAAFALGDVVAAERGYARAMALYRTVNAPVAGVQQRLALVAISRDDLALARRLLTDAVAEATRVGNRGTLWDHQYYDALLALRQGRYQDAATGFGTYRSQVDRGAFQFRLDAGTRQAEALALAGQLTRAEAVLDSAIAEIELVRRNVSPMSGDGLNRDIVLALAANRRFEFDPDLGLATIVAALARGNRVEAAFRFADEERARTLWVQLARRAAIRDSGARKRLQVLVPPALPLTELTAALDAETAVLAYSTGIGGEPSTVFVVDRRGIRAFPAAPGDSLAAPIGRFTALARSGTWATPLGRLLAERLLDAPLQSLDPAVRRLILIPDGPVYRLPLDALPLPDGSPLLARYEVAVAPSIRLAALWLRQPVDPPGPEAPIVAFGDPRPSRSLGLRRLPGAAAEARLASGFRPSEPPRIGVDATEAAFRQLDDRPAAIVHFATHARTETAGMLSSAIFLTPDGTDDGRLGPAEIALRRLHTDLVMLTGCGTSGGALTFGEGIQGLVAPFLEAGARAVVATLWDVGDAAIIPTVRRFYQELARGEAAGPALRAARLAAWRGGESPAVWAALTLTGNPRVRPLGASRRP